MAETPFALPHSLLLLQRPGPGPAAAAASGSWAIDLLDCVCLCVCKRSTKFRQPLWLQKQLDCAKADAGDGSGGDASDDVVPEPDAKLRTLLEVMAKMHKLSIAFFNSLGFRFNTILPFFNVSWFLF